MELGKIFAIWGYPAKLVADNGPPFQFIAYKDFCTRCNICCIVSAYSPESNGFGKKSVDTAKKAIKKLVHDWGAKSTVISDFHLSICVNRFLFNYRNTPSTVTGKTPNELLLLFHPRTELSMLLPQSQTDCNNSNFNMFREGDKVTVKVGKSPSMEGIVVRQCGPGSPNYLVSIAGVFKKYMPIN